MDVSDMLRLYAFNLAYARELVADVSADTARQTPAAGLENHPVFIIGHLCTGSALMARHLGGSGEIPEGWRDMFERRGPADQRLPDTANAWPTLAEVTAELGRQHERVESLVRALPAEKWAEPCEWRLSRHLPTRGDLAWFMCVTHESVHLGQLACWRRAMGLPSAMARL